MTTNEVTTEIKPKYLTPLQIISTYGISGKVISDKIGLKESIFCRKKDESDKYPSYRFSPSEMEKIRVFLAELKKDIEKMG